MIRLFYNLAEKAKWKLIAQVRAKLMATAQPDGLNVGVNRWPDCQ
jgi:hypothetical protein